MGATESKQVVDLILIDSTKKKTEWENTIKQILKDQKLLVELHQVAPEDSSHPWILVCHSKCNNFTVNVIKAIDGSLPKKPDQIGMVIVVARNKDYGYKAWYPDHRIKFITCVNSNFQTTQSMRKSLCGFISKDWLQIDRNQYVPYLDVIYLMKDAHIWKKNINTILDEIPFVEKWDVESLGTIKLPWIAICGEGCEIISSTLSKLPDSKRKKLSQPGIVLVKRGVKIGDADIKSTFQKYYSGCKIEFMTSVDFHADFERIRSKIMDWISRVQNEGAPTVTDKETTEGSKEKTSIGRTVDIPDSLEMVKQCLVKFLLTNCPDSSSGRFSIERSSRPEANLYQFLLSSTGGKSIECVVHHIDRTQVHIIVGENGISNTLGINIQARKGILKFLHENLSDEIDVIQEIKDELVLVYLERFLHEEMKVVNFNFTKSTPKRPWIFLCDTFDELTYLKLMEMSKDCKSMVLRVYSSSQNLEARDDNATTIHLILRNSEIDDNLYIHDCAKEELRRIEEPITTGNVADNYEKTVEVTSKDVSSKHQKQLYIKYMANLERRAFSNFIERYFTRIEPIWVTGKKSAEKGSLCIIVCFNLSRLQDEIAAVLTDASQDCKNMLVVIQNCREGMSPKPMLRSNPSDKVIDFTNILYDDGECYDCGINSEAREKVQAFIDNN